jgi:hypothetical protein
MKRRVFFAAAAAALVFGVTTSLAGSGIGGIFNLGQTNSVNGVSTLTGTTTGQQLRVFNGSGASGAGSIYGLLSATSPSGANTTVRGQNNATNALGYGVWGSQAGAGTGVYGTAATGTGVYGYHTGSTGTGTGVYGRSGSAAGAGVLGYNSAGGPGLQATVNAGTPPLKVNSTGKVANLNADLLDGLDSTGFWKLSGNTGTSTSFLGTSNAQPLVMKTSGVERVRVTPTGNVGIGTTTPADALTVKTQSGKYGLTHTNGSTTVGTYVDGAGGWFGTKTNNPLYFFTNDGGPSVTLATTGNLGVGTASPSAKLDVNGNTRISGNLGVNGASTTVPLGVRGDIEVNHSVVSSESFEGPVFPPDGWTTGGSLSTGASPDWNWDDQHASDGSTSAVSPTFVANTTSGYSYLDFNYTVPKTGTITFDWATTLSGVGHFGFCVDQDASCDSGTSTDGTAPSSTPGNVQFFHASVPVSTGAHSFHWTIWAAAGPITNAAAWLDNVRFEADDGGISLTGNATQSRTSGGLAKALVRQSGSALQHCYNSQGTNPDSCTSFSLDHGATGVWSVNFPFSVSDRFVSVTAESSDGTACCMTSFDFTAGNIIRVRTWTTNGTAIDRPFTIAVF